jgi:osmoprotectant transport system permease protein
VILVPIFHLTTTTAEIGLVSYTLLILIRNIVSGLEGVPADTKEAALGMGYTRRQLLWKIELPLALPVIIAGIRIATVTTIGLVTVTALIGKGGLGQFILQGLQQFFSTPTILGAVLSVLLALAADGLLLLAQRLLTPWARAARGRAV